MFICMFAAFWRNKVEYNIIFLYQGKFQVSTILNLELEENLRKNYCHKQLIYQ